MLALVPILVAVAAKAETPRPFPLKAEASATAQLMANELIVRLSADFTAGQGAEHRPAFVEDLVGGFHAGFGLPEGLGIGNPQAARLAIRKRARGRMAEWITSNPDSAEGRLQRYIVLGYPESANLDAIANALSNNPHVESVGPNPRGSLSALPDDPHVGDGNQQPTDAQWGVHVLNLPAAWDRTTGHAYVGVLDEGMETLHPDLRSFETIAGSQQYRGGPYRPHLSFDVLNPSTCSIDEFDSGDVYYDCDPGHGSHVSGIIAATSDNSEGIAGACWGCSILSAKVSPAADRSGPDPCEDDTVDQAVAVDTTANGMIYLRSVGSQILNMSFGFQTGDCDNPVTEIADYSLFCEALEAANVREIIMPAASSKFSVQPFLEFPASDPRVLAIGGLEFDLINGAQLWSGSPSNPDHDFAAPASEVLSTVYTGQDHRPNGVCGDSNFFASGYGLCSGQSMAAPYVTGLAALVRSANPLLNKSNVEDALRSTASVPSGDDPDMGYGIPNADAAVSRGLGSVSNAIIANRVTPLFAFHSPPAIGATKAETHAYTTVPQLGSAFLFGEHERDFDTLGSPVGSFPAFPGFCTDSLQPDCCSIGQQCCVGQPESCEEKVLVDSATIPKAEVMIFTTEAAPRLGSPALVPLHRLRYESGLGPGCPSPGGFNSVSRDFTYATSIAEVESLVNGVTLGGIFYKYALDGIEGYVYQHCSSGCPSTATSLHRLYHPTRHDTVLVPASLKASYIGQGYQTHPTLAEIAGYAFENVDSDSDGLVDGFEQVIGSDLNDADSDDDSISDGEEFLIYDRSNPNPALHGYGDPCSNGCPLFVDGFESGSTSNWSSTTP